MKIPKSRKFSRDSSGFSNQDPDPQKFGIFGNLQSGFFRDFQIQIPIPEILGFSGSCTRDFNGIFLEVLRSRSWSPGFREFWDFFRILKSRSRSPRFRDREKSHTEANSAKWSSQRPPKSVSNILPRQRGKRKLKTKLKKLTCWRSSQSRFLPTRVTFLGQSQLQAQLVRWKDSDTKNFDTPVLHYLISLEIDQIVCRPAWNGRFHSKEHCYLPNRGRSLFLRKEHLLSTSHRICLFREQLCRFFSFR